MSLVILEHLKKQEIIKLFKKKKKKKKKSDPADSLTMNKTTRSLNVVYIEKYGKINEMKEILFIIIYSNLFTCKMSLKVIQK